MSTGIDDANRGVYQSQRQVFDVFQQLQGNTPVTNTTQVPASTEPIGYRRGFGGVGQVPIYAQPTTQTNNTYQADPNAAPNQALAMALEMISRSQINPALNQARVNSTLAQGQLAEQDAIRGVEAQFAAQGQARSGGAQRGAEQAAAQNAAQVAQTAQGQTLEGQQQMFAAQLNAIAPLLATVGALNQPAIAAAQQFLSQAGTKAANDARAPSAGQIAGGFIPLIGAGFGAEK